MANSIIVGAPDNDAIRELRDAAVSQTKFNWALVIMTAAILVLTGVTAWPVLKSWFG